MHLTRRPATAGDAGFARRAHHGARELYQRLGFVPVRRTELHVEMEWRPA